jgi:MFS family permease
MKVVAWFLMVFGFVLAISSLLNGVYGLFRQGGIIENQKDNILDVTGAVFLIMVGIICFGIGYFIDKKTFVKEKIIPILDPNDISFIYRDLKKGARTYLILSISLLLFAIFMVFVVFMGDETDKPYYFNVVIIFFIIIELTFVFVSFLFFKQFWKNRKVVNTKIYKVLIKKPQEITAMRATFIQKENAPARFGLRINVELRINEESLGIIMVSQDHLALLFQYIKAHNSELIYEQKEWKVS